MAHSRSPEIHHAFAAQCGIPLRYGRIESSPETFAADVARFIAQGGHGLNVTLPFKETATAVADDLSTRARLAGCANTLLHRSDGSVFADNTDGAGLLRDLEENLGLELRGARVLLIGAGGAARGAIAMLAGTGLAALDVANRSRERLRTLLDAWSGRLPELAAADLRALQGPPYDLIIDATSAGLAGESPAVPAGAISARTTAYAMLYGEPAMPFLVHMRQLGAGHLHDGWGMLVEQAAESFLLWHRVRPDTADLISRGPG